MKTKLGQKSAVMIPLPWVRFLRKKRSDEGMAMWRGVVIALEAFYDSDPDRPKNKGTINSEATAAAE